MYILQMNAAKPKEFDLVEKSLNMDLYLGHGFKTKNKAIETLNQARELTPLVGFHIFKGSWKIYDWAGNLMFNEDFYTFQEAEDYLSEFFDIESMDYDEWRQEYEIRLIENN